MIQLISFGKAEHLRVGKAPGIRVGRYAGKVVGNCRERGYTYFSTVRNCFLAWRDMGAMQAVNKQM